jgi:hypothetical protein
MRAVMAGSVTATLRVQFGSFIVGVHGKMRREEREEGEWEGTRGYLMLMSRSGVFASDLCFRSAQLSRPDPLWELLGSHRKPSTTTFGTPMPIYVEYMK